MRFQPRRPLHFAGLALALGVAACGGDSNAPRSDAISEADAEAVAYAVLGNLYGSTYGLMDYEFSPYGPLLSVGRTHFNVRPNPQLFSPTSCPSFTPDPFPDADEDGVPDNTTFSFDAESCDDVSETGTTDWHGSVRVSDPGSPLGYDLVINGFGLTYTPADPGPTEGIEWDGDRQLRGSSSSISLAEDFDFRYLYNAATAFRLHSRWDVDFIADVAGSITFGDLLPAGELDVDGTLTAEGEGERFILVVETLLPLAWDPVCENFVGGTIRIYAQGREGEGAVQVTFNDCGVQPTIVFLANPV